MDAQLTGDLRLGPAALLKRPDRLDLVLSRVLPSRLLHGSPPGHGYTPCLSGCPFQGGQSRLCGTDHATPAVRKHLQAGAAASQSGRVVALDRVLLTLEQALSVGAEVLVGSAMTSADDVVLGFYRKARVMPR